jgi:hypothetical protein
MVEDKLACMAEVHIAVGKLVCMVAADMAARTLACKVAARIAADTQVCKAEEDMVARKAEGTLLYKALGKQACKAEDIWVGMVHILEDMVRNYCHYNGWNSLSTRVPRHPKKSTRLTFPVVFSLKDSLC